MWPRPRCGSAVRRGRAAARTAIVHNHRLKKFYQRLVAASQAKKVALVAVMRKMATLLNCLLRNPDFHLADGPRAPKFPSNRDPEDGALFACASRQLLDCVPPALRLHSARDDGVFEYFNRLLRLVGISDLDIYCEAPSCYHLH